MEIKKQTKYIFSEKEIKDALRRYCIDGAISPNVKFDEKNIVIDCWKNDESISIDEITATLTVTVK